MKVVLSQVSRQVLWKLSKMGDTHSMKSQKQKRECTFQRDLENMEEKVPKEQTKATVMKNGRRRQ